jgi:hypothetical protein
MSGGVPAGRGNGSVLDSTADGTAGYAGAARTCATLASMSTTSAFGLPANAGTGLSSTCCVLGPDPTHQLGHLHREGVDEHHADDVRGIPLGVEPREQAAQRVRDEQVRARDGRGGQERVQVVDDLARRCAASAPGLLRSVRASGSV